MSTEVIVYVLTGLGALVVLLTRVRLRGGGAAAGRHHIGAGLLGVHTTAGVLALVCWLSFLLTDEESAIGGPLVGIIGLGLWWIVALAGLMILSRWLPSRGRHADLHVTDSWGSGPALSALAHLGMVLGVGVFTWAYLVSAV